MATSIKITAADKITVQDTGENLLSVQFAIIEDGVQVSEGRHGFPLDVDQEDVQREMSKVLATYISDQANTERNRWIDEANAKADDTIAAIVDTEIDAN